jgi:hypothetical protein
MAEQVVDTNSGVLHWEPLAKGEVQACICDREGCCTTLTVLNAEENILEIYQANLNALHSCIARIVLPDNLALCKTVSDKTSWTSGGI